jgi:hypothetical protein
MEGTIRTEEIETMTREKAAHAVTKSSPKEMTNSHIIRETQYECYTIE